MMIYNLFLRQEQVTSRDFNTFFQAAYIWYVRIRLPCSAPGEEEDQWASRDRRTDDRAFLRDGDDALSITISGGDATEVPLVSRFICDVASIHASVIILAIRLTVN